MKGEILLLLCVLLMIVTTITRRKKYQISLVKWIPVTAAAGLMGFLGTYIMFYFENGAWYGQSFFGAILFFPILLIPVAFVFRISLHDLLDYATPMGLSLLVPFRINCYMGGCCGGKVLFFDENGIPTHFPSQLVEMVTAFILTVALLIFEKSPKARKKIYPVCILFYGLTRAILNQFRLEQNELLFGLPAGNVWSLVAIIIGGVWLLMIKNQKVRN